jgi:Ca2+-transporting ATPase
MTQSGAYTPWAATHEEVLKALEVSPEKGLDAREAKRRAKQHGPNQLREAKARSTWRILFVQFKSLMTALLAAATALSFAFGDWVEGLAIAMVILINAAIGFVTELRATRSMEALYRLSRVNAKVRRDRKIQEIPAAELVPGDIAFIEAGDMITADIRLFEVSKLQADESALTGESMPVTKKVEPLEKEAVLADRTNMLFKGTAVTRGSGEGVVVATGMNTELGRISSLVEEAEEERTPLERRLDEMSRVLIWATLAIAAVVAGAGILAGKEVFLMVETSIALAVAAVPEGLPIVATLALARGMWRMARKNALINRLSAVETLGATSVICTDKTGTLTENKMTVTRIVLDVGTIEVDGQGKEGAFIRDGKPVDPSEDEILRQALETAVFCNNAALGEDLEKRAPEDTQGVGDPMEVALLRAGAKAGIDRSRLLEEMREIREEAFDEETKMMATYHEYESGGYLVAVKGAPESVLESCSHVCASAGDRPVKDEERSRWAERNRQMAKEGLRVLALAMKRVEQSEARPYEDLVFQGLLGLQDPPRGDVPDAIRACKRAGVRLIMVTGDQPETGQSIASAVGLIDDGSEDRVFHGRHLKDPEELRPEDRRTLLEAPVFCRVSPKQKLDLIALHQRNNAIVAMTGDGVNDAPALKKADIGIAMGQRGTQVAREAADMVLKNDAFSTIATAVQEGRVIFQNIRKFVLYLLSCNVSEILAVSLASVAGAPLPILPLQILYLNLVTDVFPALALGVGKGDTSLMEHPPRASSEPILTRRHWTAVGAYGTLITFSVLGALGLALNWLNLQGREPVTVSFLTLAFAQLWHAFNMRDPGSRLLRNDITTNPFLWGALALCILLLLAAVYLPGLAGVLKVVRPSREGWLLVLGMSFIPLAAGQMYQVFIRRDS